VNVPLLDLQAQYSSIKSDIEKGIFEVLASQHFILGPKVEECEKAIARYSNCAHGIGMSSGTDALLVCLMAEGIGAGDEVITTPYTFFATAGSIARVGARPVFVDIDPATYNINPAQIAAKTTKETRAIMPVHLYGQMADMDLVMAVADEHKLTVIEDAAQAIGSEYRGKRAGSIGHYGCFSFFPSKNLGAAGDAGMVVTNDRARADKLGILRAHGSQPKYFHKVIGGNFRLDALQAAVVTAKLPHLDDWTTRRQKNAERYNRLFAASGLKVIDSAEFSVKRWSSGAQVVLPAWRSDRHIFNQYVIRVADRDALKIVLQKEGIGTEVYYPVPMHLQECFAYLGHKAGEFPESEGAARETLALPIYPELSDGAAKYVVRCIAGFFQKRQG
jgi:dTDP-4-amino-4,6-dideoxygalactose transaminase